MESVGIHGKERAKLDNFHTWMIPCNMMLSHGLHQMGRRGWRHFCVSQVGKTTQGGDWITWNSGTSGA